MALGAETNTSTLSRGDTAPRGARTLAPAAHLFVALDCEQPLAASSGYSLDDAEEVLIGRGDARHFSAAGPPGRIQIDLRVPDRRMSSTHARISRVLGRWVLEDNNSKNGVVLNGTLQTRAALNHGDVFALGRTFFLFAELTAPPGEALELAPPGTALLAPGLSTFNLELARDFTALTEVARSQVPVVVQGETGTGKEVIARAVHVLSGRSGSFVPINCGALPETLVESELFGHRRGAFTGATEDRPGLLRSASGGTLFLDEIGDLPLPLQAAFLRVFQEGEVTPLGSSQAVRVDIRVVAATHRDLTSLVERQQFRSDLYSRLAGFSVRLPPLRQRREDLGLLISTLLARVTAGPTGQLSISGEAAWALFGYNWPLNVRELEKALAVAVVLAKGGRIEREHLPAALRGGTSLAPRPSPPPAAELSPEDAERRAKLVILLREHGGNISAVARQMGVARMQIQRWLKRYRIDPRSFRS